ncbi:TetR/AcrR family transcriptional regulator [Leptolyngbya sp. FACHB-36]|uniref:TetR/AcrR family transcriptional regulator n=1 Tax=Leptolyngbya sp. FACHB-36 TaxID=2692808 RepID=UPI001680A595|nr:TetR/AcrR family transcriptional regulator [Leptolyngbya sp. FACHB-36]MBD2021219.1 TetR/AcrR family transcriptional regulator [Leptolyngbya sp. FACHB-36]
MTKDSHSSSTHSSNLRRQPKQQRGKERVEKILDAAAAVFDEVGYDATTTHLIAAKAGTAIGSLYQFFPDKAAIFKAMELRHAERVKAMWAQVDIPAIVQLPLRQMIQAIASAVAELFEQPVSRVVFVQFYLAREIFQSIDESMTQEAINFMASVLKQRNPALTEAQYSLLAEVCVHSSNAVMLAALRSLEEERRQGLTQQIEELLVSYLEPHVGDNQLSNVMKVMICPHCRSQQLSKNGYRRGKQCYRCKECGKQFVESRLRSTIG